MPGQKQDRLDKEVDLVMRKTTLGVLPALLLGSAVLAQEPQPAEPQPSATPPASSTPAAPNAGKPDPAVGSTPSNVDEHATSGSYYPYSAGTVGDDPAKPEATTAPDGDGPAARAASESERWMAADVDRNESLSKAEFERAWPSLGTRFDEIDVDHDKQLTRDELRTWHTSQKARMDADQGAAAPAAKDSPATTPPGTTTP